MFGPSVYDSNTLSDRIIIREIVEFERYCRDYELWDQMKQLFLPDSIVKISWFEGTGEAFVENSKKMKGANHKIHNTIVQVHHDKAVAEIITQIQSRELLNGKLVDLVSYVRLLYRLKKVDDLWKIYSIDCIYEKDLLIPVIPGDNPTIDKKEFNKYRSSYSNLSLILATKESHTNQNLPGIDRMDTVVELYQKYDKWLNEI